MPLATGTMATSKRLKVCKAENLSVPCSGGREGRGREKRKVCPGSPSTLNHHIRMLRISWGGRGKGAERGLEGSTPGIPFYCINNKNLLLTVVEAEKSKIKLPADSVPGEGPIPGS